MTEFDKFIKEQKDKKTEFNPEKRIEFFKTKVAELYSEVDTWLGKYIENKEIETGYTKIDVTEERLGTYAVEEKWLMIGNERVVLRPVGTIMIGTPARVDIQNGYKSLMIVLIGKNIEHFSQMIRCEEPGETYQKKEVPESLVWKIVNPRERDIYEELNKEVFERIIMELING